MSIKRATPEEEVKGVKLFREHRKEYPSEWAAMKSIAEKLGRTPGPCGPGFVKPRSMMVNAAVFRLTNAKA